MCSQLGIFVGIDGHRASRSGRTVSYCFRIQNAFIPGQVLRTDTLAASDAARSYVSVPVPENDWTTRRSQRGGVLLVCCTQQSRPLALPRRVRARSGGGSQQVALAGSTSPVDPPRRRAGALADGGALGRVDLTKSWPIDARRRRGRTCLGGVLLAWPLPRARRRPHRPLLPPSRPPRKRAQLLAAKHSSELQRLRERSA